MVPTCVITQFNLLCGLFWLFHETNCFGWWSPDRAGDRGKPRGGDELSLPLLRARAPGDHFPAEPGTVHLRVCASLSSPNSSCLSQVFSFSWPPPSGAKSGVVRPCPSPRSRTSTGSVAHGVCSTSSLEPRTLLHVSSTVTAAGVGSPTTSTCCCGLLGVQPRAPTVLIQR